MYKGIFSHPPTPLLWRYCFVLLQLLLNGYRVTGPSRLWVGPSLFPSLNIWYSGGKNSPVLSFSIGSHQHHLVLGCPPTLACVRYSTSAGLLRPPLAILPAIAGYVLYLSFMVAHVTPCVFTESVCRLGG